MRIQLDPNHEDAYISITVADKKLPSLIHLSEITHYPPAYLTYFRSVFRQTRQWDKADEIKEALQDFKISDVSGGSIYVHKAYATTTRYLEDGKKWIQEN